MSKYGGMLSIHDKGKVGSPVGQLLLNPPMPRIFQVREVAASSLSCTITAPAPHKLGGVAKYARVSVSHSKRLVRSHQVFHTVITEEWNICDISCSFLVENIFSYA